MTRHFENPLNGYVESVDAGPVGGIIFFGALYLLIKGLWTHAVIYVVTIFAAAVAGGGLGAITAWLGLSIVYATSIMGILDRKYLSRGWIEVYPVDAEQAGQTRCPECRELISGNSQECPRCECKLTATSGFPPKGVVSDLSQIEQLAELRAKGFITEEEFTAKKRQILGL